eukprot:6128490-Prymnesium_polylepis.1
MRCRLNFLGVEESKSTMRQETEYRETRAVRTTSHSVRTICSPSTAGFATRQNSKSKYRWHGADARIIS